MIVLRLSAYMLAILVPDNWHWTGLSGATLSKFHLFLGFLINALSSSFLLTLPSYERVQFIITSPYVQAHL